MDMKKQRPHVMPVKPVFPPSAMPAPDSMTVNILVDRMCAQALLTYTL